MTSVSAFEDHEEELRTEHQPGDRIITVSGMTGVGTTTISEFLAEEFDLERVSGGDFFRAKAEEHGMSIQEFDARADEIGEREGVDFDRQWDRKVLAMAYTRDDLVIEGRLAGALLTDVADIRIWVECGRDTVAERIAEREAMTVEEARAYVADRDREDLGRYEEKYGIDPRDDRFYTVEIDNARALPVVKEDLLAKVRALT